MRCTFKLFPFFSCATKRYYFYIVDWMQLRYMYTKKNVILLENLSLQLDLWKLQMTFISVSNIKWVHVSIFVVFFVPEGGRLWKSGNLSFLYLFTFSLVFYVVCALCKRRILFEYQITVCDGSHILCIMILWW